MQRRQFMQVLSLGAAALAAAHAPRLWAQARRTPDVIFVPTPNQVVDLMLQMAEVGPGDVLYDLGSGDGRIPITAAQRYGCRGVGIDINPVRIEEARANARAARVEDKVRFIEGDLFEANIAEATVVSLYLLNTLNAKLRPKLLRELRPGTRVVSHAFHMGDWKPEKTDGVHGSEVFLWRVPGKPGAR
jgi:cyclopropane fatty-acyl-phospholipid synthase-like methyltransferase